MSGEKVSARDRILAIRHESEFWLDPKFNDVLMREFLAAEQAARDEEAEEILKWIEKEWPYIHVGVLAGIRKRHAQPAVTRVSPQFSTPHGAQAAESIDDWQHHALPAAPKTATEANIVAERDKDYVRAIVNEVLEDRLEASKARVREIIKEEVIGKGWDKEGPAFVLTISKVREIVREEIRSLTSDIKPMIDSLNAIVQLLNKMP